MRWTPADAATMLRPPAEEDDKYSRGVLGVRTGSEMYPGAAVLSVEAALRTGVGMVRYLGPQRAADLVLQRRPEVVTADGRVQAWLLGSGMDAQARDTAPLLAALREGLPTVLDGGALDLHDRASGPLILTPHHRELSRIVGAEPDAIAAEPERWAVAAAEALGATVLLKGHTTFVAGGGELLTVSEATPWLATAGAGDALGGILGALLATAGEEPDTVRIAATAAVVHGLASQRASAGGPLTVLDLCAAVPAVIADLLAGA